MGVLCCVRPENSEITETHRTWKKLLRHFRLEPHIFLQRAEQCSLPAPTTQLLHVYGAVQVRSDSRAARHMQGFGMWRVAMQGSGLLSWLRSTKGAAPRVRLLLLQPSLEALQLPWDLICRLVTLYYGLDAVLETDFDLLTEPNSTVRMLDGRIVARDVWQVLHSGKRRQSDALTVAVSWTDLRPDPNAGGVFVLGESSAPHRAGVVCFGRRHLSSDDTSNRLLLSARLLRVVLHEIGHLLGLDHCQPLLCLMNGSDSVTAALAQPLHLCPFCLAKLACLRRPASCALLAGQRFAQLALSSGLDDAVDPAFSRFQQHLHELCRVLPSSLVPASSSC